jgi:hypothetical protein
MHTGHVEAAAPGTMRVTIPSAEHHLFHAICDQLGVIVPDTSDYEIAAVCPRCGCARGAPVLVPVHDEATGHDYYVDCWENPCGHVDAYDDVMLEVATQCDGPGCGRRACGLYFPHCSPRCARR